MGEGGRPELDEVRLASDGAKLGALSVSGEVTTGLVVPMLMLADRLFRPAMEPPCSATSALSLENDRPVSAAILASLNRSLKLSLLSLLPSSSRSSLYCPTNRSAEAPDAAVFVRPRVIEGDLSGGGACACLSPDVFRESHENGLLKLLGIDGSTEGRSCGIGGGDIAPEGEAERDIDEPRDEGPGGLRGNKGGDIVGIDLLADGCEPTQISSDLAVAETTHGDDAVDVLLWLQLCKFKQA